MISVELVDEKITEVFCSAHAFANIDILSIATSDSLEAHYGGHRDSFTTIGMLI